MAWTMGSWALASRVDPPRLAFSAPDTYSAQHHCHSLARCLPSRGKRGLIPGCAQHQTHQQHEQHCEVLLMGDWGPQACGAHTHLPSALSLCCTHAGSWGRDRGSASWCSGGMQKLLQSLTWRSLAGTFLRGKSRLNWRSEIKSHPF